MGDDGRFLRLLEPEYAKALAFARSLSRSRAEGDDLLQEAAERALKALGKLRDDAAFRGWFYRILVNAHRTRTRRGFWKRFLPIAAEESAAVEDYRVATWSPDQAEAARRARQALARLPAVQREAIVLYEVEGWTVEEIAALHAVSVSAVKSRLARGRERMRTFYERGANAALATEEP